MLRPRSESNVGGIIPASFIKRRMVLIPVPFASANFVSWNIEPIVGLRISDPGSPSVSAGLSEKPGLIISIRFEYLIICIGLCIRSD